MKEIQVKCNTNGEICLDYNAKANGISIVLVDENCIPVARYEFNSDKASRLTRLLYDANKVRIHFYGDIIPTMVFELAATM